MSEVRHVLGISGGKDSAGLAIYMNEHFPNIELDLYCCDTGKELQETYDLINNLESSLGKRVNMLEAIDTKKMAKPDYSNGPNKNTPFDYYLDDYKGFLPSSFARWCTKNLKLKPFEEYIGDDPTISYVAIRGDEEREAYVSTKENVQTIFPFKKNIWSSDVIMLVLDPHNIGQLREIYENTVKPDNLPRILEELERPISPEFNLNRKTKTLIDLDVTAFNYAVFHFLKKTDYPIGQLDDFPLLDKSHITDIEDRIIVRDQVFEMLEKSGVGVPQYYKKLEYEVDGKTGTYSRTRSGCFFCFYQQKIEWVWLYENNREKFEEALAYEKEGFTWMEEESLGDLAKEERRNEIKRQHLKRKQNGSGKKSKTLLNNLLDEDEKGEYFDKEDEDYAGCTVCFI
jgi:3'-phosphoadenosine 5'-phosphosulfate sulfotransferase (PAPS reductase)/FAD synthetase